MGHTLPAAPPGPAGFSARTVISRVTGPQPLRWSVTRQLPAVGAFTSAVQKYGGPPLRSLERAATCPSGPVSDSSPWAARSEETSTRSGAPFHGATGDGSTAMSEASSQAPCAIAFEAEKIAPATSSAAAAERAESNEAS